MLVCLPFPPETKLHENKLLALSYQYILQSSEWWRWHEADAQDILTKGINEVNI